MRFADHSPGSSAVGSALAQAERFCAIPKRVELHLKDLARLKIDEITEEIRRVRRGEYGDCMRQDFLNSMRAAWLPEELASAIPGFTKRVWHSISLETCRFFRP